MGADLSLVMCHDCCVPATTPHWSLRCLRLPQRFLSQHPMTADCPASTGALSPPTSKHCFLPGNLPLLQALFIWNPCPSPTCSETAGFLPPRWKRRLRCFRSQDVGEILLRGQILRTAWVERKCLCFLNRLPQL